MAKKLLHVVFYGIISLCFIPETGAQTGKAFAIRQFPDYPSPPTINNTFDISAGSLLSEDQESISFIQSKLKHGEIIIEYVIIDTLMVIISLSTYEKRSYLKSVNNNFWKILKAYRKELKVAGIANMVSISKKMYAMFISPLKNILEGKTRLIIITGRDLSGIPFESFITDEGIPAGDGFVSQHYLIQDFEIIYHYSAKQWATSFPVTNVFQTSPQSQPEIDFAGFSPVYFNCRQINPLPATRNELNKIVSMFGHKGLSTRIAFGEQSRKNLFLELACNSKVIHLATHNNPYFNKAEPGGILFWEYEPASRHNNLPEGILTMKEICRLRLKADLVVLSSCASGFGKKVGKSGLSSLPMGFLYAGAKNILATLWNVSDSNAGMFMVSFYRKWLSGKTYSQALREVKLDMIACRETALPTLWAAWVLIGK